MEITVFASKRTTKEGKPYSVFTSRLLNKRTGETFGVRVKFRDGSPMLRGDQCPCNIILQPGDSSLSPKKYEKDGVERTSYTLWLSGWRMSPNAFVDHSMDDFFGPEDY